MDKKFSKPAGYDKVRRMHWTFDKTYNASWNTFYQYTAKNMSVYQNDIELEDIERILNCMQSFPMVERMLNDIKDKDY